MKVFFDVVEILLLFSLMAFLIIAGAYILFHF